MPLDCRLPRVRGTATPLFVPVREITRQNPNDLRSMRCGSPFFRRNTSVFTAGRIPQFDTGRISKFSVDLYKREDGISHAVYVKRYSVIINDIQERLIS